MAFLCYTLLMEKIIVYQGPGVSPESLKHTLHTFSGSQVITPEQILTTDWEKETRLFIIPGGADLPYTRSLNGARNQKIRQFVENGGTYLGICAGAYFASSSVEFAKGTSLEVTGTRELQFFEGPAIGPLVPYCYHNNSGARAIRLFYQDQEVKVFYNGGCYFPNAQHVLAYYENNLPAIIECRVGKGKAILSGVHFEYDPTLMDKNDPYLSSIIPNLQKLNIHL